MGRNRTCQAGIVNNHIFYLCYAISITVRTAFMEEIYTLSKTKTFLEQKSILEVACFVYKTHLRKFCQSTTGIS